MKRILTYLILVLTLSINTVSSQVVMHPPEAKGKTNTRFYYIPDHEMYYDIQSSHFIYWNGTEWKDTDILPVKYSQVDINNTEKVMLNDYSGNKPYLHFTAHKIKYPKGYKNPTPRNTKPYDLK